MCEAYTGYLGTSEIEHGLCACTVDNPLAKARGLSLRKGAQTMLYLSQKYYKEKSNLGCVDQTMKVSSNVSFRKNEHSYSRTSMARTPLEP